MTSTVKRTMDVRIALILARLDRRRASLGESAAAVRWCANVTRTVSRPLASTVSGTTVPLTVVRADPAPIREDQVRVERLLGRSRAFLAGVGLLTIYVSHPPPTGSLPFIEAALVAYTLFAASVLVGLALVPARVIAWRAAVHVCDVAFAGLITVLDAGPDSSFFVSFLFVVLAAAVRWGMMPTVVTGMAVATWMSIEAILNARSEPLVLDSTRFVMRAAYLLVATIVLARLAGAQYAFYTENYLLSRMLGRVKRGARFAEVVHDAVGECLRHFGGGTAILAAEDDQAERWYALRVHASTDETDGDTSFDEIAAEERKRFFFDVPEDASAWRALLHKRDATVCFEAIASDGEPTAWSNDMAATTHRRLLEEHSASSCLVARVQVTNWHLRLFVFDVPGSSEADLRLLRQLMTRVAPALHSHYLVARLRSQATVLERARIARDLHDGLIQSLIALEMELDVLRRTRETSQEVRDELHALQQRLHLSVLDARDLMTQLRTPVVGRHELLAELSAIVERFRTDSGIDAQLVSDVDAVECPPRTASQIARILQEALVNVRKHARARHVVVRVERASAGWNLVIDDDGRGFSFAGVQTHDELDAARRGPTVIKERVRAVGGRLTIHSEPGRGARLEVTWPFGGRYGSAEDV